MTFGPGLDTVRDVRDALRQFSHVPLKTVCSMLATRAFESEDDGIVLDDQERLRFGRLLDLFTVACNGTGKGYVGIRWTTVRIGELGDMSAIEALRTEAGALRVMDFLQRRQAALPSG